MSEQGLEAAIERYHQGFAENNSDMVLKSLGPSYTMFSGNYSDDQTQWQAHMYLTGEDLKQWPGAFLAEAGPYENSFEILHSYKRGKSALIVTRDTGKNRFREWENEITTWLLGQHEDGWRIVGMFLKDIANPE